MSGPIHPEEVVEKKAKQIPNEVFEAFNEMIAEKWTGKQARIRQDEVTSLIIKNFRKKKLLCPSRAQVVDRGWLDIESIYREVGWKVEYDKPGYNETYPATFTFSK